MLSVCESKGIESELLPKIASGLCGRMANTSDICGAVGGAILALGLFFGRDKPKQSQKPIFSAVQRLKSEFEKEFGSSNCQQLTGCELGTKEGLKHFKKNDGMKTCRKYTEEATKITMKIIEGIT